MKTQNIWEHKIHTENLWFKKIAKFLGDIHLEQTSVGKQSHVLSFRLTQKLTFLLLVLSPVLQQLQGIKYPLLFKWMNEKLEWVEEEKKSGRKRRHLKGGAGASVCLSVLCAHAQCWTKHGDGGTPVRRNWTLGWNCFLRGADGKRGGGGVKQHTGPAPSSLTFTCPSTQRLKLQKKNVKWKPLTCTKWTKFQLLCGLHLCLNRIKKEIYNQPANVWELHLLLVVFLTIN